MLPAQNLGAYRRRRRTDAADAEALLKAAQNVQIKDVSVKNETQQLVLAVHGLREGWKAAITARINTLRGHLLGFGQAVPLGADKAIAEASACIEKPPVAPHSLGARIDAQPPAFTQSFSVLTNPVIAIQRRHSVTTSIDEIRKEPSSDRLRVLSR